MKYLLLFICALFSIMLTAQNAPINFEAGGNGADWMWTTFENDSDPPLKILLNPDPSGINTSDTVALFTALANGAPFAGCESMHGSDIGQFTLTPATSTIKIMVWKSVISDVGIKLVEPGNGSLGEIKIANTLVNEWEELSFDFSSMEGILYDQIVIFPDFAERDMDNLIYFDNITFGESVPVPTPMIAAPDPTVDPANVISLFSNVYSDVPVDTWLAPWSSGVLSDIQIQGNDTKQYSNLNFIGIETKDGNLVDASEMQYFHIDIWTPNMTTFKVKLVDFGADGMFEGGDDSEHEIIFDNPTQNSWVSYTLPFTDFPGLTARNNLAQYILSGSPAGQSVLYVDNVFFSKDPVATQEEFNANFNIFPNPAQTQIQINADFLIKEIIIYDAFGKEVLKTNQANHISIESLSPGNYVVLAIGNEVSVKRKLIKQ